MSKLTLTVDPEVVKQAKAYAAGQQQSLSKLVENFLRTLPASAEKKGIELTVWLLTWQALSTKMTLKRLRATRTTLQEKYQ